MNGYGVEVSHGAASLLGGAPGVRSQGSRTDRRKVMGQAGSSATAHRPGTPKQPTPAANHMNLHIGELLEQAPESHPKRLSPGGGPR